MKTLLIALLLPLHTYAAGPLSCEITIGRTSDHLSIRETPTGHEAELERCFYLTDCMKVKAEAVNRGINGEKPSHNYQGKELSIRDEGDYFTASINGRVYRKFPRYQCVEGPSRDFVAYGEVSSNCGTYQNIARGNAAAQAFRFCARKPALRVSEFELESCEAHPMETVMRAIFRCE